MLSWRIEYCIADIFRGDVIFAFFAVEWDPRKISPHTLMRAVLYTNIRVRETCRCCSSYSTKTPRVHSYSQFSLLLSEPRDSPGTTSTCES